MHPENNDGSDLRDRAFYGAVVGAMVGMFIGSMPGNHPWLGTLGLLAGAAIVGALSCLCNSFWESLRAAWELVRISFWRW